MKVTNLDLKRDWLEIIKIELQKEGYDLSGLTDEQISILFYDLRKKLISPEPRTIKKPPTFSCPSSLTQGLSLIEQKIRNGDDLRPHLSRKLKSLTDNDGLLYDWGIHHLHLGTEIENDGFIKRTGPLLFARFDNEHAYFLGVFSHGAWSMQDMLKTIHNHWPESIESYRLKGVLGVEKQFSDSEVGEIRNANINLLIELEPGVVYMGPGGGFVGSGNSSESVLQHIQKNRGLLDLEKSLRSNLDSLLNSLFDDLSFIKNQTLDFRLIYENGKFHLYEKNNDFYILLAN